MPDPQVQSPPSAEQAPGAHRQTSDDRPERDPPRILLDDEGTIRHVSDGARALLDLGSRSLTGEPFFDHVHPRRLKPILHDLTEMTARDKQRATWLLRLKTGLGPWRWFRVEVENRLGRSDRAGFVLRLHERGGGDGRN